jgi:hypothetical protein
VNAGFFAAIPLAHRRARFGGTFAFAADPDAVKIFRIQFHDVDYGALHKWEQGLTRMIQAAYPVLPANATAHLQALGFYIAIGNQEPRHVTAKPH